MAVTRVTQFKIASAEGRARLLEMYRKMPSTALKNGKPYILSVSAGEAYEDARTQGFTIAAISTFASLDDMKYYDNECQAHAALRSVARSLHEGVMVTYFQNALADSS